MNDIIFEKSFASHEKSKYWNYEKNNKIEPRYVFKSSNNKYWFDCPCCKHSFNSGLNKVVCGRWCSFCSNKQLCNNDNCKTCINKSFVSHEKSKFWNYEKNNNIEPRFVFKSSHNKYWFDCPDCKHSFDCELTSIFSGSWCSFCGNKQLCNNDDCKTCSNKSFASHKKSKYWNYEKNNNIKPRYVFKSSHNKYWFDCPDCKHSFDCGLSNIVSGNWCPFCSNPPKQLCNDDDCKSCINKSFASHEKSKHWNYEKNNNIEPRDVFKSSHNKYTFNCPDCKHKFDSRIYDIFNGSWCPFCSNPPKQLCNDDHCKSCINKSFASHEKSKYWSIKNVKKTRDIFKSSNNKYWFDCHKCNHSFNSVLASIVNGNWCPFCKNKTEAKLFKFLKETQPSLVGQFKKEWCKKRRCLPFDFCILEFKIIIELDGRQHFKQVSNWSTPEEQYENDKYKEKCANENGYSVIRILQEDVFYDNYDWFKKLCDTIDEIRNGEKIVNIYLCNNEEYIFYN
jgi:very-short-patch-repair endonuclease